VSCEALIESYEADAEVIDPRLLFEVADPAKRRKLNAIAPHSKQMRRAAQRLRDGEAAAVEAGRVRRLPGAESIDWLAGDPRVGVLVAPDDTVRLAEPHEIVHI
jgi:hypothetical protein